MKFEAIEGRRPPLPPLLPISLSTSELGSLSCYDFEMNHSSLCELSFLYFCTPSISLLLSGDDKESADDTNPAEHHHHHDQGQGQAALSGEDIIYIDLQSKVLFMGNTANGCEQTRHFLPLWISFEFWILFHSYERGSEK